MADLLTNLARRLVEPAAPLRPRLPSLFEPPHPEIARPVDAGFSTPSGDPQPGIEFESTEDVVAAETLPQPERRIRARPGRAPLDLESEIAVDDEANDRAVAPPRIPRVDRPPLLDRPAVARVDTKPPPAPPAPPFGRREAEGPFPLAPREVSPASGKPPVPVRTEIVRAARHSDQTPTQDQIPRHTAEVGPLRAAPSPAPTEPLRPKIATPLSPGEIRPEVYRPHLPRPGHWPAASRPAPPEPVIQVTIGRIEVRAVPATEARRREAESSPVMSLAEYLRNRAK